MEQVRMYTNNALHCVRHMSDYIQEVTSGNVSVPRANVLRRRFADAKKLAKRVYAEAFELNCQLDGEEGGDTKAEYAWCEALRSYSFKPTYGDYSVDALHTFRHLEDYINEIEGESLTVERTETIRLRLATLMEQALRLYFDEGRLLNILDA